MKRYRVFPGGMLGLMCLCCFFFGGLMLYLGFEEWYGLHGKPDFWDTVPGYLHSYQKLEETDNGTRYAVEYRYYVGGEEYALTARELWSGEPVLDRPVEVFCDLYNPEDAMIYPRKPAWPMLFLAGGIMVATPAVFLLGWLMVSGQLAFEKIGLLECAMGLVSLLFGLLFCYAGAIPFGAAFVLAGLWLFLRGIIRK